MTSLWMECRGWEVLFLVFDGSKLVLCWRSSCMLFCKLLTQCPPLIKHRFFEALFVEKSSFGTSHCQKWKWWYSLDVQYFSIKTNNTEFGGHCLLPQRTQREWSLHCNAFLFPIIRIESVLTPLTLCSLRKQALSLIWSCLFRYCVSSPAKYCLDVVWLNPVWSQLLPKGNWSWLAWKHPWSFFLNCLCLAQVYFVQGTPLEPSDLKRAAIGTAIRVVVLSDSTIDELR